LNDKSTMRERENTNATETSSTPHSATVFNMNLRSSCVSTLKISAPCRLQYRKPVQQILPRSKRVFEVHSHVPVRLPRYATKPSLCKQTKHLPINSDRVGLLAEIFRLAASLALPTYQWILHGDVRREPAYRHRKRGQSKSDAFAFSLLPDGTAYSGCRKFLPANNWALGHDRMILCSASPKSANRSASVGALSFSWVGWA
jgi:hypothetical protein